MSVIIFGAKGMLGQALEKEFVDNGYVVNGFDRADFDLLDEKILIKKITQLKPILVINAAAYNAVDKIEENAVDFQLAEKINGQIVGVMARICKENNIPLVYFSSDHVFFGDEQKGYSEDAVPKPINKYGETKLLGEKELIKNTNQYYLLRLSKLFGKIAGSAGAKKSFVDIMLDLARSGKTSLDLVDDEISSPTYAPDLAKAVRQIFEDKLPFGIYHVTNSGVCTWYEWAKEIFALTKMNLTLNPVPPEKFPRPAKRPHFSALISQKLPPLRSWQEALREYLAKLP